MLLVEAFVLKGQERRVSPQPRDDEDRHEGDHEHREGDLQQRPEQGRLR